MRPVTVAEVVPEPTSVQVAPAWLPRYHQAVLWLSMFSLAEVERTRSTDIVGVLPASVVKVTLSSSFADGQLAALKALMVSWEAASNPSMRQGEAEAALHCAALPIPCSYHQLPL